MDFITLSDGRKCIEYLSSQDKNVLFPCSTDEKAGAQRAQAAPQKHRAFQVGVLFFKTSCVRIFLLKSFMHL